MTGTINFEAGTVKRRDDEQGTWLNVPELRAWILKCALANEHPIARQTLEALAAKLETELT